MRKELSVEAKNGQNSTATYCAFCLGAVLILCTFGCTQSTGSDKPEVEESKPLFALEEFSQKNIQVLGAPHSNGLDESFKSENLEFTLKPGEGVEYMFDMRKGGTLFYSWSSDTKKLVADFHGHPKKEAKDEYPKNFWFRYKRHGVKEHNGKVLAPIDGMHGWYFRNDSKQPATISLKAAGDYKKMNILR